MTKIGFASSDWSRSVFDANGHPVMGGAGWARLGQYANRIPEVEAVGVLVHNNRENVFGVRDWNDQFHFDLDVIVMQRVMFGDIVDKLPVAQANGQIIVNDIDDWYWGLSPQNQAFLASHPKNNPIENVNHYKKILGRSDYVTTSTPYLAKRISSWVHKPIEVLPNTVEVQKFQPKKTSDTDMPTVGWVGSTAHRSGDLQEVSGVLGPMWEEGKIRLHHSGHHPQHPTFASMINVHPRLVSTSPMASPADYPSLFVFDIGIAPLTDVPFNRAKSAIKGLEYAAAGVPFVASPLDAYKDLNANGIGLIAAKRRHWRSHLEALRDPSFRQDEADKNKELVAKFDVSHGVQALGDFLRSIT